MSGVPKHGDRSAYDNFGCRCPDAGRDKARKAKLRRLGRYEPEHLPSIGTTRRLQALACLGYSPAAIAGNFCTGFQLETIRKGKNQGVTRKIAKHVLDFYNNHWDRPLPAIPSTAQVRHTAQRRGWVPPLAWDDDSIDNPHAEPQNHQASDRGVESVNWDIDLQLMLTGRYKVPAKFGSRVALIRYQKLTTQAVDVLTERGLEVPEIAELLNTSDRSVARYRAIIKTRRAPIQSGPQGINNATVVTTPSTGTPREARVA